LFQLFKPNVSAAELTGSTGSNTNQDRLSYGGKWGRQEMALILCMQAHIVTSNSPAGSDLIPSCIETVHGGYFMKAMDIKAIEGKRNFLLPIVQRNDTHPGNLFLKD
jgi:hypothetical protein